MVDLHICRICLNTAVRGCKLDEYILRTCYECILREKLSPKDILPQWVCYECGTMLHKFHKFKEKCIRGQLILKQISLREKISYEAVASVNRYSENLISPVGIAKASRNVKTIFIKHKQRRKSLEIKSEANLLSDKPWKISEIKRNSKIDHKNSNNFNVINEIDDIANISVDYNTEHIDHSMSSDDEKTCDEPIKNENIHEKEVIAPIILSTEPIKSEYSDCNVIDKHLSNISSKNNLENTEKDTKNYPTNACDLENTNYDLDTHFDTTDNLKSSDEESLFEIAKKRSKVKHKNATNTKTEQKLKKTKTKNDKEVVLKNTKPLKLVLNPQFWKKINLTEEEAVKEFKQREFNNDYYLKAKFKCHDCFKGFSKNEMLERHLKQRHDETIGTVECRFCRMRFRHKHQLVKHIKEHLIVYNCLLCKLQCSRLSTAITHQEHHKGVKKTCKHCGKEFNHLSTYYTHVRMSHRSAHVCVACGASFVSEHGLLLHTKFMHIDHLKQLEEQMGKRREANKVDASNEQTTAQSAPAAEEVYCGKCDIKFMSRRAYNLHFFKSDNHDDGDADAAAVNISGPGSNSRAKIPTKCPHCEEMFPTRVSYKKHHLAVHPHVPLNIPKKRDICEVCGASVQMGSIQYHMKSHTGEREFACPAPDCYMRFTLKRNMKRHYNVKHLGMPSPKYVRRNPTKRKKKTQEILENDFSPFVRSRTGYFL